jgi:hypothetical protein
MTYTHTRIRKEYLDKLQVLARANKRSAMKQLEVLIDDEERRTFPLMVIEPTDIDPVSQSPGSPVK